MTSLHDRTVLVVGRGSGIARATVDAALRAGARVVVAGRDEQSLAAAYAGSDVIARPVDLTDEGSVAALAEGLGPVDHVVSTASARARGLVADLDPEIVTQSFRTKVVGTLLLAKHFAPRLPADGSFVFFSGHSATKTTPGTRKAELFDTLTRLNPARRIGTADEVAEAVLFALTNSFVTGASLPVDGGEPLV